MTDTTYEVIELRREGAVGVLTLNRPEKYNAINNAMHRDLRAVLRDIGRDSSIRALVFTGNGKAFCAGQDLTEFGMQEEGFRVDEHVRTTFNRFVLGLRELPIPVIAAVNGVAAGAGASLALAADLRIMSSRASIMQAFIRIGIIPDTGSTWLLPQLIGIERALEMAWSGDAVDAARSLELGLCSRVVEPDDLMPATMELATRLAGQPTRAIGMTKRAMYRALTSTFEDSLEYEAQLQQAVTQTSDHHEGVLAFLEKREPAFTGA